MERLDRRMRAMTPDLSWTRIRDAIERGQVMVDGEIVRDPGAPVAARAAIDFDPVAETAASCATRSAAALRGRGRPRDRQARRASVDGHRRREPALRRHGARPREGLRHAPPWTAWVCRTAPSARPRHLGRDGARAQPRGACARARALRGARVRASLSRDRPRHPRAGGWNDRSRRVPRLRERAGDAWRAPTRAGARR